VGAPRTRSSTPPCHSSSSGGKRTKRRQDRLRCPHAANVRSAPAQGLRSGDREGQRSPGRCLIMGFPSSWEASAPLWRRAARPATSPYATRRCVHPGSEEYRGIDRQPRRHPWPPESREVTAKSASRRLSNPSPPATLRLSPKRLAYPNRSWARRRAATSLDHLVEMTVIS
jgi:hypothetical protein